MLDALVHQLFHSVPGVVFWILLALSGCVLTALTTSKKRWNFWAAMGGVNMAFAPGVCLVLAKTWWALGGLMIFMSLLGAWFVIHGAMQRRRQGLQVIYRE